MTLVRRSINLLLAAAALQAGCGEGTMPAWSQVAGPYPQMLFSVWGSGPKDLWAVGGCDESSCAGMPHAKIVHNDGSGWKDMAAPVNDVLWWVFGFGPNNVWMAGEHGTVIHWDGSALKQVLSQTQIPGVNPMANLKLFGIWGATPNDVWTVGGVPDTGPSAVLRWDGVQFTPVMDATPVPGAWYKVWGSAADDIYLVGQMGTVGHYDGKAWQKVDVSAAGVTREPLFTAAARAKNDVYIVGGIPGSPGLAIHFDGAKWSPVMGLKLDNTSGLTGVFASAAGDVAITGFGGAKFMGHSGSQTWRDDSRVAPADADFHAVWLDAPDDVYAAGGAFVAEKSGVIAHYGK